MITAIFKQIVRQNSPGLFYILAIILVLVVNSNAAGAVLNNPSDTTGQTKFNALTAEDRLLYTLSIDSGKFIKGICDPEQLVYQVIATLINNSSEKLEYLDWSSDPQIWFIDKGNINVVPEGFSVCDSSINHNYLTTYEVQPHQNYRIKLRVIVNGDVVLINQKFKIGIILQRVLKKDDWNYYVSYFEFQPFHELYHQTLNIIWSNYLIMKR